uniref:Uncharacterized protein n=1 Tax=Alexandrium monilatum TaxID=311494 RepID=A0A7S4R6A3_9DINO
MSAQLEPFVIKARRKADVQEKDEGRRKHRRTHGGGHASSSPKKHRSQSTLRAAVSREEAPEQEEHGSLSKNIQRSAALLAAGDAGRRIELECELEVTNDVLKRVQEHAAELSQAREAAEEQVKTASASLEVVKARKVDFQKRVQAAVAEVEEGLRRAKDAVGQAEAKIEAAVRGLELETAAAAKQAKVAKDAAADALARISALEAANPGLASAAGTADADSGAEAAKEAAEGRLAAMQAKLDELKENRSKALAALAAQESKLGELGSQVVELEAKLAAQLEASSNLQERVKELGLDKEPERAAKEASTVRKPPRLYAVTTALPEVAGEYKLLPEAVADRPAYAHKGAGGASVYLFWSSAGGRCSWNFAKELPSAPSGDVGGADASQPERPLPGMLAESVQDAWTVLPDELASSRWDAGCRFVDITLISAGA